MQAREVYIKADGNGAPLKVVFEGQTFGELKTATAGKVSWDNCIVRVKGSKVDLVDNGALIPAEGPVYILTVPQKQKGGASRRDNVYADIKELILQDGAFAKAYFSNYPQLKTDVLVQKVNDYVSSPSNTAVSANGSTVESTPEMQAVREAFVKAHEALNVLGQIVMQGEESFGGVTLSELNAEWASVSK